MRRVSFPIASRPGTIKPRERGGEHPGEPSVDQTARLTSTASRHDMDVHAASPAPDDVDHVAPRHAPPPRSVALPEYHLWDLLRLELLHHLVDRRVGAAAQDDRAGLAPPDDRELRVAAQHVVDLAAEPDRVGAQLDADGHVPPLGRNDIRVEVAVAQEQRVETPAVDVAPL